MGNTPYTQDNGAGNAGADSHQFTDGITNSMLRIGLNTGNTMDGTYYAPEYNTIKQRELEYAYQTSWLCQLAVDAIAEDMTREGIEVKCDNHQIVDKIERELTEYSVFERFGEAIKWSRLYGGAIAVILINGQDYSTPLTSIPKGSFRGLAVFDRWQIDSSTTELVQDLGADFGKPRYYRILDGSISFSTKIHYSRVIRFEGKKLPYNLRQIYGGWGASVLESVLKMVKGFDLATQGAMQLLSKSYLRFYKVKGLRDILTNEIASQGFLKQMDYTRFYQNIEGMTLGDADDEFQTFTYSFTGIPELILQIGQQISGALGIPLVRLFGQSPVGFNATGESDIRNYYDAVKKEQTAVMYNGVKQILEIIYRSVTGASEAPDDLGFTFKSLWQMTSVDKATVASATLTSVKDAYVEGMITLPQALKELKSQSDIIGLFGSITDEDIAEAERQEAAEIDLPDRSLNEQQAEEGAKPL